MKKVTLRNNFHNTKTSVRCGDLSPATVKRVKTRLCCSGCTCSGFLGLRGPQDAHVPFFVEMEDGGARMGEMEQ